MKTSFTIVIPAPAKCLNPNSRAHWRAVAKAKKHLRTVTRVLAIEAGPPGWKRAAVWPTFFVKDRRKRDGDNATSSLKAAFDGLEDAGVIENDSGFFHYPPTFVPDKERAGTVELTIREMDQSVSEGPPPLR